jgi:hypothetical protein
MVRIGRITYLNVYESAKVPTSWFPRDELLL